MDQLKIDTPEYEEERCSIHRIYYLVYLLLTVLAFGTAIDGTSEPLLYDVQTYLTLIAISYISAMVICISIHVKSIFDLAMECLPKE